MDRYSVVVLAAAVLLSRSLSASGRDEPFKLELDLACLQSSLHNDDQMPPTGSSTSPHVPYVESDSSSESEHELEGPSSNLAQALRQAQKGSGALTTKRKRSLSARQEPALPIFFLSPQELAAQLPDLESLEHIISPRKQKIIGSGVFSHFHSAIKSPYPLEQLLRWLPKNFAVSYWDILRFNTQCNSLFIALFALHLASGDSDVSILHHLEQEEDWLYEEVNPYYGITDEQAPLSRDLCAQLLQANRWMQLLSSQAHSIRYFLLFGTPEELSGKEKNQILINAIESLDCDTLIELVARAGCTSLRAILDEDISRLQACNPDYLCDRLLRLHTLVQERCADKLAFKKKVAFFESL